MNKILFLLIRWIFLRMPAIASQVSEFTEWEAKSDSTSLQINKYTKGDIQSKVIMCVCLLSTAVLLLVLFCLAPN